MTAYVIWNNKGGTGKTSLAFFAMTEYAIKNPTRRILAVDLCPQANLSELLLGGLIGSGGSNLASQFAQSPRRSVGGYFDARLRSPYLPLAGLSLANFTCTPHQYNQRIPTNLDLLAGDPLVELQSNAISTLANNQVPGIDTWQAVIDWIRDLLKSGADSGNAYDDLFLDANPSFSMYTQIALATGHRLILPATADDSSRRGIHNALSLVYGVQLPSAQYQAHTFPARMQQSGRALPLTHLLAKNRLTQYMGAASAYGAILSGIDADLHALLASDPNIFTFTSVQNGVVEIRDFQTAGVVALAYGSPFSRLPPGLYPMPGRSTRVNSGPWAQCVAEVDSLVYAL